MLDVSSVSVERGGKRLLLDVSLSVSAGELMAVIGPNGAGKSTLLKTISGELTPDRGTIAISGKARSDWRRQDLALCCSVMGQSPTLAFDFTVKELVELGRAPHSNRANNRYSGAIVDNAIEFAGLADFRFRSVPSLSGGERQRAFFAKSIAQIMEQPDRLPGEGTLFLLDEPTSALDLAQQARMLDVLRQITEAGGAVLCVLHDLNLAAAFADKICVLQNGRAVACDEPSAVITAEKIKDWYGCRVCVDHSGDGGRRLVSLARR